MCVSNAAGMCTVFCKPQTIGWYKYLLVREGRVLLQIVLMYSWGGHSDFHISYLCKITSPNAFYVVEFLLSTCTWVSFLFLLLFFEARLT